MRFQAEIQLAGKTATGFEVPPEVVEGLGAGRKPAVLVTVGGHTYRSTIAPRGDRYLVPVSGEHRKATGVTAGDVVDVVLEIDSEPRVLALPDDFVQALEASPEALRFFDGLSYSKQRWFVLPIEEAKKPDTRQRRIAKAVEMLAEGRPPR